MYTSFFSLRFYMLPNAWTKRRYWKKNNKSDKHIGPHKHTSKKKRKKIMFIFSPFRRWFCCFSGGKWIFGRVNFCSCQQQHTQLTFKTCMTLALVHMLPSHYVFESFSVLMTLVFLFHFNFLHIFFSSSFALAFDPLLRVKCHS